MCSLILCEGGTDSTLIQYFMREANNWSDNGKSKVSLNLNYARDLKKEEKILTIGATGGCSKIISYFEKAIERNILSSEKDEIFNNIVIISDRDEISTTNEFEKNIENVLSENNIDINTNITNDLWVECYAKNAQNKKIQFRILLLLIPFEETGALETFLLNAIGKDNSYDNNIIQKGNSFVDTIDPEKKYLNSRRYITKAKFDVYFSVRTVAEQFSERQNILKGVKWEEYELIQNSFKKLKEL